MSKKHIVVLTGAGISAESGIKTFRDADGLWENHKIEDVATPEAWYKNPELVTQFYNQRRKQLAEVQPNDAHFALKKLEKNFKVSIITQNVDDLHERAGSSNILHLHGKLREIRSTINSNLIYDIGYQEVEYGKTNKEGHILRPNIVWFGEAVPMIEKAQEITEQADIFMVIGTSLEVYPAAGLFYHAPIHSQLIVIDPNIKTEYLPKGTQYHKDKAGLVLPKLVEEMMEKN